jgi:hypothetical protein
MLHRALGLIFLGTVLLAGGLVSVAVATARSEASSQLQQPLQFQLGFKTLADMIPRFAGQPVEAERATTGGDILQQTTTGLMVWRKAGNETAFTDGAMTWVNSRFGLLERPNDQRFQWESSTSAAPPDTFSDPFIYCTAIGTVDQPDARYTGPAFPDFIGAGLARAFGVTSAAGFTARNTFWRCMDSRLLACTVGANLNCGFADTSNQPTPAISKYCQDNPQSDFIPLAVVGHSGIYDWQCKDGNPVISRQGFHADSRGFVSEFWHEIPPPSGGK